MTILNKIKTKLSKAQSLTLVTLIFFSFQLQAVDFTINQRVKLNNIQEDITRVALKCALTCKARPTDFNPNWMGDLFAENSNYISGYRLAANSQTVNLPLNNGAVDTNTTFRITIENNEYAQYPIKKENVDGFVCVLGFWTGGSHPVTGNEVQQQGLNWTQQGNSPSPPGIQLLPFKVETTGQISNPHNLYNSQNCVD
ncbi:MAG: hypothetical protein COA74_01945 [Gammaproteobacteria bacterium]|nr:MAG: hypothetical protein COA74_01945 [Gammaproteobacteria bacterium]